MKKLFILVLCALLWAGQIEFSFALPITADLKFIDVDPHSTGKFHFGAMGNLNVYYGQFNFQIDLEQDGSFDPINGFCVEDSYAPNAWQKTEYELKSAVIDSDWIEAAWVFEKYHQGQIIAQVAQIAIWELVMDDDINLNEGNFHVVNADSGHVSAAATVLAGINLSGFEAGDYCVAINPVGSYGQGSLDYQNYIFRNSVPVPSPGAGVAMTLGALGIFWLRKKRRKTII